MQMQDHCDQLINMMQLLQSGTVLYKSCNAIKTQSESMIFEQATKVQSATVQTIWVANCMPACMRTDAH